MTRPDIEAPERVKVRAIDVKPYRWALWCSIEGGPPFENEICLRRWSDDGQGIWFMLESHNFLYAEPNEILELVPYTCDFYTAEMMAIRDAEDEKKMSKRPYVQHSGKWDRDDD